MSQVLVATRAESSTDLACCVTVIYRELPLDAFSTITDRTMASLVLDDLVVLRSGQAVLLHDVIGVVVAPARLDLGAVVGRTSWSRVGSLAVRRNPLGLAVDTPLLFTSSHWPPPKDQPKVDSALGCP